MALTSKIKLVTNMEDIRLIVKEVGKRLVHFTDIKDMLDVDIEDPHIVSVCHNGEQLQLKPGIDAYDKGWVGCDAFIISKNNSFSLNWNKRSQASLRKSLSSNDDLQECLVCFEESRRVDTVSCMRCHATMCSVCYIKISMAEKVSRCPECRCKESGIISTIYVRVMDRLSEFTPLQQYALKWIKDNDPEFEVRLAEWEKRLVAKDLSIVQRKLKARWEKSRQLKPGCTVKLCGLKKKDWNGRTAVIIGKKEINNGIVRWPIQLKRKCKSKALLKECNMKKKELKEFNDYYHSHSDALDFQ